MRALVVSVISPEWERNGSVLASSDGPVPAARFAGGQCAAGWRCVVS
ncbi:MAG: hypothetical protein WBA97_05575 [Actinophytocola sp.]